MKFRGRRALLLGLGRFGGGVAAARYLLGEGAEVRIADRCGPDTLRGSLAELGRHDRIEWCLGSEDPTLLRGVDLVVANPAVPQDNVLLLESQARGVEITQEVNLFLDAYPGQVVLVTGTNGKSTTATLLAAALRAGGVPTLLGGNIGNSLLHAEARSQWQAEQIAVVEISSFQLERLCLQRHRVLGSVLTRITEDHLDRHGSLAAYHAAKARAACVAKRFLIHGASDGAAAAMTNEGAERITYTTETPRSGQVGVRDGWLWAELHTARGAILHPDALLLQGRFQIENVLAAAAAACTLGVGLHPAATGICLVRPLPHRLQLLCTLSGVEIHDNSVSTQVESTLAALDSIPGEVHWVGGGKSKGGDIGRHIPTLAAAVASAHLFGAVATDLAAALEGTVPTTVHVDLESALDAALERAHNGEAILFSPAFSSHDQFVNYVARAERFHAWAERHRRGGALPAQARSRGGPQASWS